MSTEDLSKSDKIQKALYAICLIQEYSRLLGFTQASKLHGCYTEVEARTERDCNESIEFYSRELMELFKENQ